MAVTEKVCHYGGFGRCLRIENDDCELYVTLALGPRIIRFNRKGGKNVFWEDRKALKLEKGPVFDKFYGKDAYWRIYGGHRIWFSPESMPESYYPDNGRVKWEKQGEDYIFTPKPQTENGVAYTMIVRLAPKGCDVDVTMQVKNIGKTPKTYGVWSISVMNKSGLCALPLPTEDVYLLHNRQLSLWTYTHVNDRRFYLTDDLLTLRQDPKATCPFKIGLKNTSGVGMYYVGGDLFVKKAPFCKDAVYPDNGCNFETYTCAEFLELESLGPLCERQPGEIAEHTEHWTLIPNVARPDRKDEETVRKQLSKF